MKRASSGCAAPAIERIQDEECRGIDVVRMTRGRVEHETGITDGQIAEAGGVEHGERGGAQ